MTSDDPDLRPTHHPAPIDVIMRLGPVIPVLVIDDVRHARPIAEALVAGGIRALEVTLRTPAALDVIAAMAEVEGAVVGAGTVLSPDRLRASVDAGARFIVSPGLTEQLGRSALDAGIPFLPGTATASDVMRGLEMGFSHFKFFPASASGGVSALKAIMAPLQMAKFCPTGGIDEANAPHWLELGNVLCVGGSWLTQGVDEDYGTITDRARRAVRLNCRPVPGVTARSSIMPTRVERAEVP